MLLALADLKRHRGICIPSYIQILDESFLMKDRNFSDPGTLLSDKFDTPFTSADVFESRTHFIKTHLVRDFILHVL